MATWTVHAFRLTAYGTRAVYVGVSWHHPAERLSQHLAGHKSSRQVRYGQPELAEDLYGHLAPFYSRQLAEDVADDLAADLILDGYDVRCDPNRLARIFRRTAPSAPTVLFAAGEGRPVAQTAHPTSYDQYAA
jgi:hypothetical protein